ncbi:putative flavonol 3-O-glucosyltransferase [Helianthus annuus]|nr:putative flavonol 3-O-glucosyltransferase [Helianthus annuus]
MANAIEIAELIFIPVPVVGHIMSTIELAKLLVNRDQRLAITVLVIKPPGVTSGPAITTYIESLAENTMDRISFIQLPQDEAIHDPNDPMNIKGHCKYVRNIVADLKSQPGSGRVVGFVVDMFCICMIDVANEFNVPTYVFVTSNAAFLGFTLYLKALGDDLNKDVIELCNSDTEIFVPSFVKPVPTKVFWGLVKTRAGLDIVQWLAKKLGEAKAIMVNTLFELETHAIESLSANTSIPPVYPVGPILNLEGGLGTEKPYNDDIIRWLDSQPSSSVVFLCFGSMGSFDEVQVKEIARGVELGGYRFLWSLRRTPLDQTSWIPSDYEDPSVVLPEGFLERTHGLGKVIGWSLRWRCLVMMHLWFGVPSAAWPMYAEQQMNAFKMVMELGLAVEIKLDYVKSLSNPKANIVIVTAEEIESGIRRVMEDNEVRRKVKEMSAKSRSSVVEGGSSYASIGSLIQDFLSDNS